MKKKDLFSIITMLLLMANVIILDLQANTITITTNVIILINILVNAITLYLLNK